MKAPDVYRNRGIPLGGVLVSLIVIGGLVTAAPGVAEAHGGKAVALWILFVLGLAASLYALATGFRCRVLVTPGADTFTVQNPVRRYEVKWDDVSAFEVGAGYYGIPIVVVRLKTDRRIECHALSGKFPKSWGTTDGFLREFCSLLESWRARRAPTQGARVGT